MFPNLDAFYTGLAEDYGIVSSTALEIVIETAFVWVPLLLIIMFWQSWINYIQAYYIYNQGHVLFEIKLPREVTKTPAAMEVILNAIFQKGEPETFRHTYWEGKLPPWFSLEIVSNGGYVHFYVWGLGKFRNIIPQQFYAQYPSIEVNEVEDYTLPIQHDPSRYEMWGGQFRLAKKSVYPIKTYIDHGLDKPAKEEEKTDPLTSVLEYLGGIEKGAQVWIQLLIKAHRKQGGKDVSFFGRPDWTAEAHKEVKRIRDQYLIDEEQKRYMPMVESDTDTIKAIRRSIAKHPFNSVLRVIYIAEREVFNPGNITGLLGTLQQYNSNELNGFRLHWKTDIYADHPWKDFRRSRELSAERKLIDAYKRRSFFYPPYKNFQQKPFILTTEEIATMFHIPGSVALTPTLSRVPSRRGEAPANLPTE